MDLSIELLATLSVPTIRSGLAAWVASHIEGTPDERAALEAELQAVLDAAPDSAIEDLRSTFVRAGDAWRLHRADPLARAITRLFMGVVVRPRVLTGVDRLRTFLASPARRRLIVCNHLSYTDTQVTDVVLAAEGLAEVADRLVAVAGPKVYTDPWRRMASIALHTRKTAQSSTVASEQDTLTPRELAAVALDTLADCARLMDEGYLVLLYPEGTRSRDGRLQPFLRAAARYLAIEGVEAIPLAQVGGAEIFPRDASRLVRSRARLEFGESFRPGEVPGKLGGLEEMHRRLGALLPEAHRPDSDAARVL